MGLEHVKCFRCQRYGHLEKDCPENTYAAELADSRPPWCSQPQCDRATRLIYTQTADGLKASRCTACHPKARSLPAQFSKCNDCGDLIYRWDIRSECRHHQPPGKQLGYVGSQP